MTIRLKIGHELVVLVCFGATAVATKVDAKVGGQARADATRSTSAADENADDAEDPHQAGQNPQDDVGGGVVVLPNFLLPLALLSCPGCCVLARPGV